MAASQGHDCCDRARRTDVFRGLRIDRAGGEQVREQSQKTVYKAAAEAESEGDRPNLSPVQKVPGE